MPDVSAQSGEMKQHYCGCCGCEIPPKDEDLMWCKRCDKHVLHPKNRWIPWHERTYFAQHGKDCPFQVNVRERAALGEPAGEAVAAETSGRRGTSPVSPGSDTQVSAHVCGPFRHGRCVRCLRVQGIDIPGERAALGETDDK